jgi:hypothetical protein
MSRTKRKPMTPPRMAPISRVGSLRVGWDIAIVGEGDAYVTTVKGFRDVVVTKYADDDVDRDTLRLDGEGVGRMNAEDWVGWKLTKLDDTWNTGEFKEIWVDGAEDLGVDGTGELVVSGLIFVDVLGSGCEEDTMVEILALPLLAISVIEITGCNPRSLKIAPARALLIEASMLDAAAAMTQQPQFHTSVASADGSMIWKSLAYMCCLLMKPGLYWLRRESKGGYSSWFA